MAQPSAHVSGKTTAHSSTGKGSTFHAENAYYSTHIRCHVSRDELHPDSCIWCWRITHDVKDVYLTGVNNG